MTSGFITCHDVLNCKKMKYALLIISIILIIYPIYSIIKCLQVFSTLTNYGMGVLVGGIIFLLSGSILMYFTIKSIKRKKIN
jgi:hypothetical protein